LPGHADSLARIVRLSYAEGEVQVDRQTGHGFERAILNLPITQGMQLRTGGAGRAEVEFEDGTTIRLAPSSQLDFQQLSLRDSGAKASMVELAQGTAYFDVHRQGDDKLTVAAAGSDIAIKHSSHFRVIAAESGQKIAVYSGELWVKRDGEQVEVKKGDELSLDVANHGELLAKEIQSGPYDDWDKQRAEYHERYYTASNYNNYPYYGRGDLSYYGGWYGLPGYGSLWQPFNVGLGWSPFDSGYWGWYPGSGYAWISGYPWGWLPYRYGSWAFVPGWGWGWSPGAQWGPWLAMPGVINAPAGFVAPRAPIAPNRPIFGSVPAGSAGIPTNAPRTLSSVRPTIQNAAVASATPPAAKPPAVAGRAGFGPMPHASAAQSSLSQSGFGPGVASHSGTAGGVSHSGMGVRH
jgi:hypothetical protein